MAVETRQVIEVSLELWEVVLLAVVLPWAYRLGETLGQIVYRILRKTLPWGAS